VHPDEIAYGAVIGALIFTIKEASRQFSALPVIMQAFAALIFPRAAGVRAGASGLVLFRNAFHVFLLSLNNTVPVISVSKG
jgi:hypothetical protein